MTTRALDGAGRISFDEREQERLTAAAKAQLADIMADPFLPRLLIRDRQTSRVAELLRHAFETVPIYNEIYKKARVTPADFRTLDDLCIFPIITKSDFHARNLNSALSEQFRSGKMFETRSCGTSGVGLSVRFNLEAVITDTLQGARQLALQGSGRVHPGDLTLHYYVCPWWTSHIGGEWRSEFVSMGVPASEVVDICRRSRPSVLAGYPTAVKKLMAASEAGEFDLKLIITNSEQSCRLERDHMSAHFNCPVLDEYSSEELTRIAIEMPDGLYYVHEDSVFLEILDLQTGLPVKDGEWGEVIATGMLNDAMPFIRYATGDLAKRQGSASSTCGMGWGQLGAIGGRIQDSFFRYDNSVVPSGIIHDLIYRAMSEYDVSLQDYRLVQLTPNKARFSFVRGESQSNSRLKGFLNDLRPMLEQVMRSDVALEFAEHKTEDDASRKRRHVRCQCVPTELSHSASSFKR
jgi:phenylacetate-CoA ligase